MASYTWKAAQSGNWDTTNAWNPAGIPGSTSGNHAVTIAATGTDYTVTYDVTSAKLASLTINSANASLTFDANDTLTVTGSTALTAGTINLLNSGAVLEAGALTTGAGSIINIGSGGTLSYNSANLSGIVNLTGTSGFGTSGQSIALNGTIEATSGTATVNFSGISGTGWLEADGGRMVVAGILANKPVTAAISNSAASVFETSGALYYGSNVSVKFLGSQGEFKYTNASSDNHVKFNIAGLNAGTSTTVPTNTIDLPTNGLTVKSGGTGTGSTGSVVLSNGDTLNLSGITGFGPLGWQALTTTDSDGGTDIFLKSVCYAAGTQIQTPAGEKAVEDLTPGDIVLTLAGEELTPRPVKWLGTRRIDLTTYPRPETVAPIRIRQGAFADNTPHRDLLVSPDHALFIDGKLIAARQLVNGATIAQEKGWKSVEYFHVELDRHAILLAEGLPAESYLDTGNRGFFANSGEPLVLHPDLTREDDNADRAAASCAPFVWDEPDVRPVWQRLADRAAALGQDAPEHPTTTEPGLHLVAKGRRIRPIYAEGGLFIFPLPRGANEVQLASRAAAPADTRPWLDDRRPLGVNVARIVLRNAEDLVEMPVDHPGLTDGWWTVERYGPALRRWTNGAARLPLPPLDGPAMLEIRLGGEMIYPVDQAEQPYRKVA